MQGLLAALVMFVLLVVLPLCLSVWGAYRLFRWAGSGDHTASAGRRRAARALAVALVVVVWGGVAAGVVEVTGVTHGSDGPPAVHRVQLPAVQAVPPAGTP